MNLQEGRAASATPAPRHMAADKTRTAVRIADFTWDEIARCAAAPTCRTVTAARPVPKANSTPSAPTPRVQVPTMANVSAMRGARSTRAALREHAAVTIRAIGKCTTTGCQPGTRRIKRSPRSRRRSSCFVAAHRVSSPPGNGVGDRILQPELGPPADLVVEPLHVGYQQGRFGGRRTTGTQPHEFRATDLQRDFFEQPGH